MDWGIFFVLNLSQDPNGRYIGKVQQHDIIASLAMIYSLNMQSLQLEDFRCIDQTVRHQACVPEHLALTNTYNQQHLPYIICRYNHWEKTSHKKIPQLF